MAVDSGNSSSSSKVKKVSAYPFSVQIKTASNTIAGQIQKLTLDGFLAEIPSTPLQPGDRLEVSFEIPVYKVNLNLPAVMVKVYSHWGSQAASPAEATGTQAGSLTERSSTVEGRAVKQLVEVHFQPLSEAGRSAISQFMRAIRQV